MFLFFLSFFAASAKNKLKKNLQDSNLIYLTESNMTSVMKNIPALFLFVHQGGDKNEQFRAKVEFGAASADLGTRCYFAIMDGEKNRNFVRKVKLIYTRGYYFFRYGKLADQYTGPMNTAAFFNYAMSKTGRPFTTFEDYPNAQDFIESSKVGVVLYIPEISGKNTEKFTELAEQLRDNYTFGLCADELLADDLGITKFPTLVLYRQIDKATVTYQDDFETGTLLDAIQWINYNSKPQVDVFQLNNQDEYVKKKPVIVFFVPIKEEERSKVMPTIVELSKVFGTDLNFTQIDAVTGNRFMMDLGFSHYADPCVAILKYTTKGKFTKNRYPEEADFLYDNISMFIMNYLDGKMKNEIKSEKINPDYNGSIEMVVADNFQETVIDPDVAVLVLYYEPWDHTFITFKELYTQLADEFVNKSVKRIKLAAFDVSNNDIPIGPEPKKTPCLYLFNRGMKDEPELYTGKFRKEDILDFLDDETGLRSEL